MRRESMATLRGRDHLISLVQGDMCTFLQNATCNCSSSARSPGHVEQERTLQSGEDAGDELRWYKEYSVSLSGGSLFRSTPRRTNVQVLGSMAPRTLIEITCMLSTAMSKVESLSP